MGYDSHVLLFAFGLTLFAGLSTGIGSTIAFFAKQTNTKFLSWSLGFSAGVMIYVSFVEIFFKGRRILADEAVFGERLAQHGALLQDLSSHPRSLEEPE